LSTLLESPDYKYAILLTSGINQTREATMAGKMRKSPKGILHAALVDISEVLLAIPVATSPPTF
jgi:hypothetical protein